MKWQRCAGVMAGLILAVVASAARADVFNMGSSLTSLDFVTVGNPGNANDIHGARYGKVDHVYQIGKYEVTAAQYVVFLNAVAATDSYGLYSTSMWSDTRGCKIQRSGTSGNYTYSVAWPDRVNRPVNHVSWGNSARFMNWLHNGQPIGAQGLDTTEDGAYYLNGAITLNDLMAVTRKDGAKFWIPTENEWYKAAYYDPNKGGKDVPGYWDYPTGSDSKPSNKLTPDVGNNANFDDNGYTIGSPYWMTEVGAFTTSESPYGTFDQGGNVWEWNEAARTSSARGLRGGSWYTLSGGLLASTRYGGDPAFGDYDYGFRVASVPEPGSLTLVLCGALAGLYWWRRRK